MNFTILTKLPYISVCNTKLPQGLTTQPLKTLFRCAVLVWIFLGLRRATE